MVDETGGYGQQDPADSVGDFNPHAFAISQMLNRVSTMKIVKVLAVDTAKQTVNVQIAVNQVTGNGDSSPHGTINGVPYIWAMGGKNAFQTDPAVGDMGVMVVCDRDLSSVKAAKDIANPGSNRKFSPSDGIYLFGVPGLNGTAPVQWVKWTDDGIDITAAHGNKLVSSSTGWLFTGPVTIIDALTAQSALQLGGSIESVSGGLYAGNIHTAGTVTGDTDVVAAGKSGATHTHGGVIVGGGTSGPPT